MRLACLLLLCVIVQADEKPKALVISVPEVDQLQWANLRLDAQGKRAQAEVLRLQAEQLDAKANEKLVEIKKTLAGLEADQYDFELTKEGKMQLIRKKETK